MHEHAHELLDTTFTTINLHRKIMLLEQFFEGYFFKDQQQGARKELLKEFLFEQNVGEHLRSALLMLSDQFFDSISADNFRSFFDSIRDEEKNRPHMTIYVPTILPPVEVEKLGIWSRENIAQGIFIDLEVDSRAVGGCAFVWNGVYHDYSLRYHIDKNRTAIRTLMTKA